MLRRLGFDTANVAVSICSGLLAIPRSLICSGLIWGTVATVTATIAARRQAAPISTARIFLVARRDITLDSPRLCSGLKREAMVKVQPDALPNRSTLARIAIGCLPHKQFTQPCRIACVSRRQ